MRAGSHQGSEMSRGRTGRRNACVDASDMEGSAIENARVARHPPVLGPAIPGSRRGRLKFLRHLPAPLPLPRQQRRK